MALITSLAALAGAAIFCIACAGLGHRLLKSARLEFENTFEQLLCSIAVGVIGYEIILGILEFGSQLRLAVAIALVLLLLSGAASLQSVLGILAGLVRRIRSGSRHEHSLAGITSLVVIFIGITAMAPLSGSDALHYHFTSPLLALQNGFVPAFSLVHSFFTGQGY
jgi:type III secretory pathway component EscS